MDTRKIKIQEPYVFQKQVVLSIYHYTYRIIGYCTLARRRSYAIEQHHYIRERFFAPQPTPLIVLFHFWQQYSTQYLWRAPILLTQYGYIVNTQPFLYKFDPQRIVYWISVVSYSSRQVDSLLQSLSLYISLKKESFVSSKKVFIFVLMVFD